MSERIRLYRGGSAREDIDLDSYVGIILLTVLTEYAEEKGLKFIDIIPDLRNADDSFTMELKINGIEVPIKESLEVIVKRVAKNYDDDVAMAAQVLFKESFSDKLDELNDVLEDTRHAIKDKASELFPKSFQGNEEYE